MNKKNGFAIIELMFVLIILAFIFVFISPYVINTYLNAQKDTFVVEAKNIYSKASEKYAAELVFGKKYLTITDTDESSLKYGEGKIKYCVHMTPDGYVQDIKVVKGKYYLEGGSDFTKIAKVENIKYGEMFDKFSCDYQFDEKDLVEEPTPETMRKDERYVKAMKIIGIAFVIVIVLGLISKRKSRKISA